MQESIVNFRARPVLNLREYKPVFALTMLYYCKIRVPIMCTHSLGTGQGIVL